MLHLQVPQAGLGIFHHDRRYCTYQHRYESMGIERLTHIREPRRRQPHRRTTHQRAPHHQQIRMRILHVGAHLLHQR